MQAQNKIAVGVGVVLIVLGFVYVRSSDKKPTGTVADNSLSLDEQPKAPVAESVAPPPAATPAPVADKVASPTPRRVDTVKFASSDENPRPKPSVTKTPEPSVSVTTTPPAPERAGLSSIPPTLPVEEGSSPASIEPTNIKPVEAKPVTVEASATDMPPNVVVKEAKPRITVATPAPATPRSEVAPKIGAAANPPATARTHVIQKGDTYTSLAVKYLGHAKHAKLIAKANPGCDAGHLYVGAKINIPDAATATIAPPAAANATPTNSPATAKKANTAAKNRAVKEVIPPPDPSRAYVVQRGDSWQSISRKFLGKGENDAELYELNKERVGGDPHLLRSGLVIELPARAKAPAKTAPTPATPSK